MEILKEFLNSQLTQTEFGLTKGVTQAVINRRLHKCLIKLQLFSPDYLKHESTLIFDVLVNKKVWLTVIELHSQRIMWLDEQDTDNRLISSLTVSEFLELLNNKTP